MHEIILNQKYLDSNQVVDLTDNAVKDKGATALSTAFASCQVTGNRFLTQCM